MSEHEPGDLLSDYFPRADESVEDRVARWGARDIQIGRVAEERAVDHLIQENHRLKVEWKMPWRPARRVASQHLADARRWALGKRSGLGS